MNISMWLINNFHIQILVLELLFCWRLPKRNGFWFRFVPLAAVYVLLPKQLGGFFSPYLGAVGWFTFGFLIMLVLSGLLVWFSFRMNVKQLVFYCCVAHTLQHIVHCLSHVCWLAFSLDGAAAQLVEVTIMILITIASYFLLREQFCGSEAADVKSTHLLVFAAVSTLIVYVISFWTTQIEVETIGEQFFDLFSCLLLLTILFDIFRLRKAEREQLIMMRLLRQEQAQHALSKATTEVINRKCHDLKHQISALRNMPGEEQERSIAELEQAVLIYDSFAKSGNEDLDIILAEKSLLAEKQGVRLHCIADGKKLSFMRTEDLYALMGNALDNAIESTAMEENPEKRIITLNLSAKGNILTVHIENPCAKEPLFADGLPLTTKPDTDYHGYGMRSMRYIAEKYGGVMTTGWEDGAFSLDLLFP